MEGRTYLELLPGHKGNLSVGLLRKFVVTTRVGDVAL